MESTRLHRSVLIAFALLIGVTRHTGATEVLCDPARQDCKAKLLTYIRNEIGGIDVAMWFMEDPDMANALIARHQAAVPVRALVDPRRNALTPMNATILEMLQSAGVPIRAKSGGGILHWKFMIAANVSVSPNTTKSYSLPPLAARTTYYWRIVSKTAAGKTASGAVRMFITGS